ncbi:hypothetical protein [Scytonema sp. PCC 10023]|uniref:hypothetical protein n=1 Tax=Scytonema sp. PCC 10023 TaxID=1680591 RepID=UPI0039C691BA
MEKKGTKWIPDEPDINKQQGDQTKQEKPEDSKKEVTEAKLRRPLPNEGDIGRDQGPDQ